MVNVNSPSPPLEPAASARSAGSALYAVAALALIVAIGGLGLAYGARAWLDAARAPADPALTATHMVTIGAQPYVLPAALLTDPVQRRDGFAERIDLTLALPLIGDGQLSEVAITIMPRGRVRTSAALLDSVYLHQFGEAQLSGVPGLVGKPLEADAGTAGETVWYDPLSAGPFVAKCMAPVGAGPDERNCLRVFALPDRNTAIVAFDADVLVNWRDFDARIEAALAPLRK